MRRRRPHARPLKAIACDVNSDALGLILEHTTARGQLFRVYIQDAIQEPIFPFLATVEWCMGVRADVRWIGFEADEARGIRRRLQTWLAHGGRTVRLIPL